MPSDVKTLDDKTNRSWVIAGLVGIATLGVAAGAQAGEGHGHGKHHHGYYAPQYVAVPPGHVHYYAPAPVYYVAPRPVMVYPAPVAYVPAYPVYAAPPGLNLNLNLPLR